MCHNAKIGLQNRSVAIAAAVVAAVSALEWAVVAGGVAEAEEGGAGGAAV